MDRGRRGPLGPSPGPHRLDPGDEGVDDDVHEVAAPPLVAPPPQPQGDTPVETEILKTHAYGSARASWRASAKRANASSRSVGRSMIGVT